MSKKKYKVEIYNDKNKLISSIQLPYGDRSIILKKDISTVTYITFDDVLNIIVY